MKNHEALLLLKEHAVLAGKFSSEFERLMRGFTPEQLQKTIEAHNKYNNAVFGSGLSFDVWDELGIDLVDLTTLATL